MYSEQLGKEAAQEKPTGIFAELDKLNCSIEQLYGLFEALADKMSPTLKPATPKEESEKESAVRKAGSDITESLLMCRTKVSRISSNAKALLERIDL